MTALTIPLAPSTKPKPRAHAGASIADQIQHQATRLGWMLAEREAHPMNPELRIMLRLMHMELDAIAVAAVGAGMTAHVVAKPEPWRIRRGVWWRLRRWWRG